MRSQSAPTTVFKQQQNDVYEANNLEEIPRVLWPLLAERTVLLQQPPSMAGVRRVDNSGRDQRGALRLLGEHDLGEICYRPYLHCGKKSSTTQHLAYHGKKVTVYTLPGSS